ncbi:SDR family NAD(P)-dependent oxidoreductase [Sphingomonas sp. SRS2]|uniref:SDR family NAD(P)-dependent oxidoreductase n=1 Tax=Sphingomonas sp. SRS2 TaxID=133190 RepID=UPI00061840CA|nr:SDR family NAD(P)-dependent oxidoreductase [Sphingomonas sp. SRS2]KKC26640.1 short-chain dehydrogenase [Sphingomonas sp. SRS2]
MSRIWFITGASRGFGRIWATAALARGDRVAVTARDAESLSHFTEEFGDAVLPLTLDVTDAAQAANAVVRAHDHFGRLDVVVNNAGYMLVGTVEEASEAEARALFDTNYFGTLSVIQAALPLMRAQGGGHIIGVSSALGLVSFPLMGLYCASKWAVEALHEGLAQEVAPFGIKVTLVEPGPYATDLTSGKSLKISPGLDVYAASRQWMQEHLSNGDIGDPDATAAAILAIVDAERPPLRIALGSMVLPMIRASYADRIATWDSWEAVSNAAQGEARRGVVRQF